MQKKYIIILVTIGVIVLSAALALAPQTRTSTLPTALPVNPAGQAPAYNEPPIVVTPASGFSAATASSTPKAASPAASVSQTGALLVPPPVSERQAYEELFALLNRGKIIEKGFTIEPVPTERKIIIYLDTPIEESLPLASDWLVSEGYGDIPKANIRYVEK